MPKELVFPQIEDDGKIEISWGAHGRAVQIGTLTSRASQARLYAEEIQEASYEGQDFGFYVNLTDRAQINDFIRKLRRARDHAFGADE